MLTMFAALAAASAGPLPQPLLEPWSMLVGHCWVGEAPQNVGPDKHCFEYVYGGQHVRDRHVVSSKGREVYAGETLYSVHGDKVVFTYWNSLGGLGTGEAVYAGGEWRFTGTIHATPKDEEQPIASLWKKADGAYEVHDGAEPPRLFKRAD